MKNKLIIATALLLVLSTLGFAGCRSDTSESSQRQIATVERGDLTVTVPADGNLDMPRQVSLKFGTPGTVKEIFVVEGQKVREGTLLAKLDDTTQKLAVSSAQYNVELAMNELVEKINPALMGYPEMYPDTSTVLRVEQAQDEMVQAQKFLEQGEYQEAAAELRLAEHDLDASYKMLNIPEIVMALQEQNEISYIVVDKYPNMASISRAIKLIEEDLTRLAEIQTLIEQGSYDDAMAKLDTEQIKVSETHGLIESLSGRVRISQRIGACCQELATQGSQEPATGLIPIPYPDTSTSLAWLKQVEENLQKIQACEDTDSCDALELSTLLRMAQHDIEMSRTILEDNELIFRGGVSLKALRTYNLNVQLAEDSLKNAKQGLMNTEILAPFDGTVVDIGVKENDQLSAFDYSSKTAVHLVDTNTVEMDGVVDEVDIYKVQVGQETTITVDALPNAELRGKVTFISPFGTQTAGVVEFPVKISLESSEVELKGGLTATADIIVEKHENVLLVPNRSVKGSPGNYYVEVVIDEEKVTTEKRPVALGAQNEQFSEVISGLSEGEKIIVEATRGRLPTSL